MTVLERNEKGIREPIELDIGSNHVGLHYCGESAKGKQTLLKMAYIFRKMEETIARIVLDEEREKQRIESLEDYNPSSLQEKYNKVINECC